MKFKKFIFDLLEPSEIKAPYSKAFNIFLIILIILNVIAEIIGTVDWIRTSYRQYLYGFGMFSLLIFSIEYILRMWTITNNKEYSEPVTGRIKYFFSFFGLIDLISILPFFLTLIIPFDLRFLRIFRLLRIFRVFKLGRYSESLKKIGRVFVAKKEELFVSLMAVLFLVVLSASMIYILEHEAQPEIYSNIPNSIYWSFITLTTVGYGDIYPVTPLGKLFTIIVALLGVGMIALPTAIISSGFSEELSRGKQKYCPHCGKKL